MDTHALSLFLLRCAGANFALLLLGFAMWTSLGAWMHRLYSRIVHVDRMRFDTVVLALFGAYKIGIALFFLVPGLVLRFTHVS